MSIAAARADSIKLVAPGKVSRPVILLDGRRASGCVQHQLHRLPIEINLLAANGCAQRVAVFSRTHGAALIEPGSSWTDRRHDVLRVPLPARIAVPVYFWVLYETPAQKPARHLTRARRIFGSSDFGIDLEHAATKVQSAPAAWDEGCRDEAHRARALVGHVGRALNVYYVRDAGARGVWCAPNTILLSQHASESTLAHEIGHALGLEHTEHVPGMSPDNLMNGGGAMQELTLGQAFRANFGTASLVNLLGLRAGPVVDCGEPGLCPVLTIR